MKLDLVNLSARHLTAKPGAKAALARPDAVRCATVSKWPSLARRAPARPLCCNVLACALQPSAGTLQLDGADPWTLSAARAARLAWCACFWRPRCRPCHRASASSPPCWPDGCRTKSLWASVRSLFYPTDIALAERALARFDLADKLFERVDRLSGGERQRVGAGPARGLASATVSGGRATVGAGPDAWRSRPWQR